MIKQIKAFIKEANEVPFEKMTKEQRDQMVAESFQKDLERWDMTAEEFKNADKFTIIELEIKDSSKITNARIREFFHYIYNVLCVTSLTVMAGYIVAIPNWLFVTMLTLNILLTLLTVSAWLRYYHGMKHHYNFHSAFYTTLGIIEPDEEDRLKNIYLKHYVKQPIDLWEDIKEAIFKFI